MAQKPKSEAKHESTGIGPKSGQRTGLMTASSDFQDDPDNGGLNPRDYVSSLARGLEVLWSVMPARTSGIQCGLRRIHVPFAC